MSIGVQGFGFRVSPEKGLEEEVVAGGALLLHRVLEAPADRPPLSCPHSFELSNYTISREKICASLYCMRKLPQTEDGFVFRTADWWWEMVSLGSEEWGVGSGVGEVDSGIWGLVSGVGCLGLGV